MEVMNMAAQVRMLTDVAMLMMALPFGTLVLLGLAKLILNR